MKLELLSEPLPDPVEPEGGWKPVCRVEDHTFRVLCEAGAMTLECVDAHSQEELAEMEPNGCTPGCHVGGENLMAVFGPFKLKWEKESHGWEYPNDFDYWVEVVEERVTAS